MQSFTQINHKIVPFFALAFPIQSDKLKKIHSSKVTESFDLLISYLIRTENSRTVFALLLISMSIDVSF